jgi:hypothetical protein
MGHVGHIAGQQIVDGDDRVTAIEQRLTQVRADESRTSGYDGSGHSVLSVHATR